MKLGASSGGGDFPLPKERQHAARCIGVVDCGTHENSYQGKAKPDKRVVSIRWELNEKMEDGRPFAVSRTYTVSSADTSHLHKMLKAWLPSEAYNDENKAEFELFSLVGKTALVKVYHKTKGENVNANVDTVVELPEEMPMGDQINESFTFDIDEIHDVEKLKGLWGLERWNIERSREFVAAGLKMPEREKKEEGKDTETPW